MGIFYSSSRRAFFDEGIHGARMIALEQTAREKKAGKRPKMVPNDACSIPDDAVEITRAEHTALLDAQSLGQQIVSRSGRPVATDRAIAPDVAAAARRRRRDFLLAGSDWTQLVDALLGEPERKAEWADYRQALRDLDIGGTGWPAAPGEDA